MKTLSMVIVCLMAAACAYTPLNSEVTSAPYEYRYRLFYASEIPPKEELTSDNMARYLFPLGSLNRAIDQFTSEGFSLESMEKGEGGEAYLFTFKRPAGYRKEKVRVQISSHLYGVYSLNTGGEMPSLVVLAPAEDGLVKVIQFSGVTRQNNGVIDGEHIYFTTANSTITLTLTEDGNTIKYSRQFHTEDKPNRTEYMGVKVSE